jgi:hypothetical protein
MSGTRGNPESTQPNPERRAHSRRLALSLAYVDLGASNGGILLNIGAGGMAIATAEVIHEEHFSGMRFQLPQSTVCVEASGQIRWTSESKKEAGVRFVNLSEEAAAHIDNWLSSGETEGGTTWRGEDVHTSAQRAYSRPVAADPAASTRDAVMLNPCSEGPIEPSTPGRSFIAALQKAKTPDAAPPPVQFAGLAQETNDKQPVQIFTTVMDLAAPEQ